MTTSAYALALHTCTPQLGLAIDNFAGDGRSQTWELGREMSTHLHIYLGEFIQPQTWKDLAFLAVAKGPGGFTGTRLGVVTARTLAQQLDIPLFAVSTLAAIAHRHADPTDARDIAVQMRAQREELFVAIYGVQSQSGAIALIPKLSDTVMPPDRWQHTLNTWQSPFQLITAEADLASSVTSILQLAYHDWQQGIKPHWSIALPYYGQHPVKQ